MAELRTHRELIEHGETAVVSSLLSLPAGFVVLPHLILPAQQWQHDQDDIDVVVLGPNGLFLLEYKHWHGRIAVSPDGPWQHTFVAGGREERRNPLPHLSEKRRCLVEFLADRNLDQIPFFEVLAFPDRSPLDGAEDLPMRDGVRYMGEIPLLQLGQLVGWLTRAGQTGVLSRETQLAIAEHLRPNSPRRLVNQYQLTSRLGRTEEKTTYLAYDTVLERPVLLQELNYDPYQQPAQLERVRNELLREAKLTMQLRHNHIVNVEHVIPRDDCYYVITEWIENCQTLQQFIARRENQAFPVEHAVAVTLAIAEALEYAHSQGIVHRDVRPENILVGPNGVVKVANFGLAKKSDIGTRSTFDLRQMAQENPYVAPEFRLGQAGHHQVDQRADIFSLGAMLYQLLTGRVPHHLDEKYFEAPSSISSAVPASLDAVVEKALRFDPAQRFSTMSAMRTRLADWQADANLEHERYVQRRLVKRTRSSLVSQAFDTKLQRQVGLKKLLLDPRLTDAERQPQLKQLLREAQLASSLVHPHIISVFDHFIEDGDGFIVMEWLEGQNLRELMDAKVRLSWSQIQQLVQQVADALQYAHSQGVIHRDIKPENIIYHQGQATVLDFGIAHTADRAPQGDIAKTAGTARYMAPEVLAGGEVDVRTDVFSLGVVVYELITNQYPYEASVIMARYTAMLLQSPPPPSSMNIDCPQELDAVLLEALQVDPERRHATVADFMREFLSLDDRRPTRYSGVPGRSFGWPLLVGLSFIVFLMCLFVGLYVSSSMRTLVAGKPLPSPSLQPTAIPSLTPTPLASSTPSPSPTPMVTATPLAVARPGKASWVSAPETIEGVSLQVERIAVADGKTDVTLRVENHSNDVVSFLSRNDRPDLFQLTDDRGQDYSKALDLMSVDPQLLRIEPGAKVAGTFRLNQPVDANASSLTLMIKEYDGKGRKFPLRTLKMLDSNP